MNVSVAGVQVPDNNLFHEWHVQINQCVEGNYDDRKFMYDAKDAAAELPRLVVMFGKEWRVAADPQAMLTLW